MALYLNNLNLNKNQLQKAVIHPLGTAPTHPAVGQIYYDTGSSSVYVCTALATNAGGTNGTWLGLGGDLTGITAGAGLTGTATSGSATLAVGSGGGITVNADDIAITAAQTDITSIYNTSLKIGRVATGSHIDFSANASRIDFAVGTEDIIKFKTGGEIEATKFDGALEGNADTATALAAAVNIGGVSFTGASSINLPGVNAAGNQNTSGTAAIATTVTVADESSDTSCNVLFTTAATGNLGLKSGTNLTFNSSSGMLTATGVTATFTGNITGNVTGNADTATKIATITNSDIVQLGATQTLTNKTIAASQVTEISGITTAEGNQIKNIDSTTITATQWGYLGAATGAITNTDANVNTANLKTALGDGFPDNAVTIGDSDDVVTFAHDVAISGDLTVTGDTITTNTETVTVKDPLIRVANANAVDSVDFGLYGTYVSTIDGTAATRFSGMFRDASESTKSWVFFKDLSDEPGATTINTAHSSFAFADIKAATGKFTTVTGNGSQLTSLNGSSISSGTVAADRIAALATSKITSGTFANALIASGNVTQHEGSIDHDALTNYAANEHFTQANITTVGTIGTGVWQGTAISTTYLSGQSGTNTGDETKARINALDITELGTISSGVWQGSVIASAYLDSDTAHVTQTQTLTNKTLTSPVLNTGVSGTAIKDQDDMSSNSATHLATQQSIKAYVDAQGSSSSNTGGRQAFVLTHVGSGSGEVAGNTGSANGNNIFTITHGMGASRNYGVEVIRNGNNSGGGETVIVDVTRPSDTTIVITFAANVVASDYTALVCKY